MDLELEQQRLNLEPMAAQAIRAAVEAAYRDHQSNLQSYRKTLAEEYQHQDPLSEASRQVLARL